MAGGGRCAKDDGFGLVGVEAKAVEEKPATDCRCAWSETAGVVWVVVVQ